VLRAAVTCDCRPARRRVCAGVHEPGAAGTAFMLSGGGRRACTDECEEALGVCAPVPLTIRPPWAVWVGPRAVAA